MVQPIAETLKQCPVPREVANGLCAGAPTVQPWARGWTHRKLRGDRLRPCGGVGVKIIVFGSGAARAIPEGYDRSEGWRALLELGRRMGRVAVRYGVMIAVEPLNRAETNVLTAVGESASDVRKVGHPSVRPLVDAYPWAKENDSPESIGEARDLLCPVHVATLHRRAPGLEPHDFRPFFSLLKQANYEGRMSIEARFNDLQAEAGSARCVLLEAAECLACARPPRSTA